MQEPMSPLESILVDFTKPVVNYFQIRYDPS